MRAKSNSVERVRVEPSAAKLPFRADVEGLRAVAVLLVMADHARLPFARGGFVGVDVFFVISGYLITRVLVDEVRVSGKLHLAAFYARRARRLLPASVLTLLVSAVLTVLVLPGTRWTNSGIDIAASAAYLVNWEFSLRTLNYFHASGAPSIVQHFWSLAVEEQFYILWPLLIVLTSWVVQRRPQWRFDSAIGVALISVLVPSLLWSVYYTRIKAPEAYFVSTTRLWELALGALITLPTIRMVSRSTMLSAALGVCGFVAIAVSTITFSPITRYPGYHALLPTVGAAAIILAGDRIGCVRGGPASRLLGTRPMVAIGRYSYSLYLCHWPAIVCIGTLAGGLSAVQGAAVAALSALPAFLLHRYVENPIRRPKGALRVNSVALKSAAFASLLPLLAGAGLYLVGSRAPEPQPLTRLGAMNAAQGPIPPAVLADPDAILGAGLLADQPLGDQRGAPRDSYPVVVPEPRFAARGDLDTCTPQGWDDREAEPCLYGAVGSRVVVDLVGDSHAAHWESALNEIALARGWEIRQYAKRSCAFADVLTRRFHGIALRGHGEQLKGAPVLRECDLSRVRFTQKREHLSGEQS